MQSLAPPPAKLRRTQSTALRMVLLIVISTLLWSIVSAVVLDPWLEGRPNSSIWRILYDAAFGLIVAAVAYWLVRENIKRNSARRQQADEALARYARSMVALYQTSLEINSQPDVSRLLNAIVQRATELLGVKLGGIYLVHAHDEALVLVASQPADLVGAILRMGEGLAGWVAQTGEAKVVSDYAHWAQQAPALQGVPPGRVVGVPLRLKGVIIGVLTVNDDQAGTFTDEEVQLVSLLADQAAIAIGNRQLQDQMQQELIERKYTEEALIESEERYRTLIENQGEGICQVDEQETFTFANPAADEIFGLPPGGLAGRNLREFLDEAEFAAARQRTEARRTGLISTDETRVIRADGQVRTLLVTARPRHDQYGQFTGVFSIFRDITERKEAEQQLAHMRADLERRNQQLTQILEAGNTLRATLNLDDVLREIVQSARRALGYEMVVLNILDPASDKFRVHSFAGLDEAGRQVLENAEYDREQELRLMRPEFLLGRAYFIPAGAVQWEEEFAGPMYTPDRPPPSTPDAWDPDDVLFIPIELRTGEIVGTMWLDAPEDDKRPTADALQPLEIFVNQAAIAIENARLFEAERQRRKEVEAVYQASLNMTVSLDLDVVLPAIMRATLALVSAESVHIFLYDGERLQFGAAEDHSGPLAAPRNNPRPEGLTYTVARSGQAIFVEDTGAHPLYADPSLGWRRFAIVGIPLMIEAKVVGVMNVSYSAPRRIVESERRSLMLLATHAAIAIQNARLHEQAQRHAEELEQRVAERTAELEYQRQHLQAILDSAGEGIQIIDSHGRIEYINPAMEQLTGAAAHELRGQFARLWDETTGAPSVLERAQQQFAQGRAWRGEIVSRRKDGALYDSAVTVAPLKDRQRRITGYVAVHRDITHLKELERLKDQFVENIGHELRTPLAIIKLHVELLERGKPEKFDDYLQTLYAQIDRLRRLIDGFLEMSQFDMGLVPVQRSTVNLNPVVRELLLDRRDRFAGRDLTLIEELADEIARRPVQTDRSLVSQAIGHMLDNALYYTPRGGSITVTTAVQSYADQEWEIIAVHNSGPGISPEEMPHLFERFYRGEAARDYKTPGAGLGLSITQAIADMLDGRLTVDNTPGQGVTFTLWLK